VKSFDKIYKLAAARKGGPEAVEVGLILPKPKDEVAALPDHRVLAALTSAVFSSGFKWDVIKAKWAGFEEAFHGFDIAKAVMLHGEDFDKLLSDTRIVRHGAKIMSVHENAVFLQGLSREHGSAAKFIADWPDEDYVGLLELLKKRGSRLGGKTAQYALRTLGKDSFILSWDVVRRLEAEGVIDGPATSAKALAAIQAAFNTWAKESGRSLTEISRVLAMSL
jgi:3-methyladenine DNA glycosylase Tag